MKIIFITIAVTVITTILAEVLICSIFAYKRGRQEVDRMKENSNGEREE
jgi:hypothetical protein